MRRKDKEVTSREWMERTLDAGEWLTLAMRGTDGEPYAVPLNYGYCDGCIIVHGATEGTKISALKKYPRVCFSVVTETELVRSEDPSNFSEKYKSVIGRGDAEFIDDTAGKRKALSALMRHYNGPTEPMSDETLAHVAVIKIKITEMTGKISGYSKDGTE